MSAVRTDLPTVTVCLLVIALGATPVVAAQAGTPTATTAGTDDGGGPAALLLLVAVPILMLVGVVGIVVRIAERRAADTSTE